MNNLHSGAAFSSCWDREGCPVCGLKSTWDTAVGACTQRLQWGWEVSVRRGGDRPGGTQPVLAGSGRFHSWAAQPGEWCLRGMYLRKGEMPPSHEEPLLPYPLSLLFHAALAVTKERTRFYQVTHFTPRNESRSPNRKHPDLPVLHQEYLSSICISF